MKINSSLPHFYGLLAVFFVRGTFGAVGLETGSRGSQFSRFGDNTWAIFQLRLRRAWPSFHHRPFACPSTVDASRENPNVSRSRFVDTTSGGPGGISRRQRRYVSQTSSPGSVGWTYAPWHPTSDASEYPSAAATSAYAAGRAWRR